ncbi:hypothetical protein AOCH_002550, partial [Aspergillus ochraceoroseus]
MVGVCVLLIIPLPSYHAPAAPQLPTRFPCWCRAVYSWGGETKRDLGFVEGDLIECLNAGDGQWWMGRLRRDRRMVGLFPSNFVQVLQDDFVPVTRSTSPMIQAAASPISNPTSAPKKQKTVFRKPFQAHREALAPSGSSSSSTSPVTIKPGRTPTTATRQQSSLSRPLVAISKPPPRAISPRPPQDDPSPLQHPTSNRSAYRPPSRGDVSPTNGPQELNPPPPQQHALSIRS